MRRRWTGGRATRIAGLLAALTIGLAVWLAPRAIAGRLNPVLEPPPTPPSAEARALHRELIVADLHADVLLWDRPFLTRASGGHADLPRMREGRVALQMLTAVTQVPRGANLERNRADSDLIGTLAVLQLWPPRTWTGRAARALHQASKLEGIAAASGGRVAIVRTRDDLDGFLRARAPDEGTVGALLGIEGAHALEGDLANLDRMHAAGFRMLGLVHLFDNAVGGSAHGTRRGGLTDFGRRVVRRAEDLGVLLDLAHASDALADDVLALARAPLVISHTGLQGTCPGPRNIDDARLRAVAATGGVVGVGLWPDAICGETVDAWAEAVRYAVDRVGVAHVALGSDWDGAVPAVVDAAGTVYLVDALLRAGFRADDVRAIMGGNTIRVLRASLPEARVSGPPPGEAVGG